MDTSNPYEPSPHNHEHRTRFRIVPTSTEVFTVGAIISLLVLMFAPAQPHPKDYTVTEKILLVLTTSWLTIVATILGFATLLTGLYHALRHVLLKLNPVVSRSSKSS
jgi:disulfide bond formation protein DsbB